MGLRINDIVSNFIAETDHVRSPFMTGSGIVGQFYFHIQRITRLSAQQNLVRWHSWPMNWLRATPR